MSKTLRTLHDMLLDLQPEGASHDASTCGICSGEVVETAEAHPDPSLTGGSVADKTYTEDEYNALSAEVDALKAKVTELSSAAEESVLDAKVAEVKAELEAQVADLQSKLDAAVIEAEAAKKEHTDLVAYLETEETAAREAAELEVKKAERTEKIKEVASFPDDYLEANIGRFVAMDDDAFEATLEGFKAVAAKTPEPKADQIPDATAMTAARTTTTDGSNPLRDVLGLRRQGVDPRSI